MNRPHFEPAKLYRSSPVHRFNLAPSLEGIQSRSLGITKVLSSFACTAAVSCSRFETLQVHADRILANATECPTNIREILQRLVEDGILIDADETRLRAKDESETHPPISILAIPTSGRPYHLRRAVRTYMANIRYFDRSCSLVIAEDFKTTGDSYSDSKRAYFSHVFRGTKVYYIRRSDKARYVKELSSRGDIPEGAARFALFGAPEISQTYGANRNAILLQTCGHRLLCADDDTVCTLGSAPGTGSGLRIDRHGEVSRHWFFSDRKAALRFPIRAQIDLLAQHERFLGSSVAATVNRMISQSTGDSGTFVFAETLNKACAHMWLSICARKDRILLSTNGSAGDSGMENTCDAIQCEGEGHSKANLDSSKAYREALLSRAMVRQVPETTISHAGPLMAMVLGIDNRTLLPPFCPVYRNEDGVFGQMLFQCCPHGYMSHLPFVIRHIPEPRVGCLVDDSSTIRFSDIVLACLSIWPGAPAAFDPGARMRSIGRHMTELARLRLPEFVRVVGGSLVNHFAAGVVQRESVLARYSPAHGSVWGEDLRSAIRNRLRMLESTETPMPVDVARDHPSQDVAKVTRDLVGQVGEVLYWWPSIMERARELADRGIYVSRTSSR